MTLATMSAGDVESARLRAGRHGIGLARDIHSQPRNILVEIRGAAITLASRASSDPGQHVGSA